VLFPCAVDRTHSPFERQDSHPVTILIVACAPEPSPRIVISTTSGLTPKVAASGWNLTLGARAETPPEAHVPSPRPCQLADVPNVSGGGLPTQVRCVPRPELHRGGC
jgi:hypothetical protein